MKAAAAAHQGISEVIHMPPSNLLISYFAANAARLIDCIDKFKLNSNSTQTIGKKAGRLALKLPETLSPMPTFSLYSRFSRISRLTRGILRSIRNRIAFARECCAASFAEELGSLLEAQ